MDGKDIPIFFKGYRYFYRVYRNKSSKLPPIFFVSGAFQDIRAWKRFVEFFAQQTTVIVADLPGTGNADLLPQQYDLDFLADSALRVLNKINIDKVCITSVSYSSPIAYSFAQKYPDRVSHLVLAGIMKEVPLYIRDRVAYTLVLLDKGRMLEFAQDIIGLMLCQHPGIVIKKSRLSERILLNKFKRMSDLDLKKYEENIRRLLIHPPLDLSRPPAVPSLLFTGEYDVFTKPEYCREIASVFSDAVFATIQNADHLFHIEQLQTTLLLIDRFFKGEPLEEVPGCNRIEYFSANSQFKCRETNKVTGQSGEIMTAMQ